MTKVQISIVGEDAGDQQDKSAISFPYPGQLIEGKIIAIERAKVVVDLGNGLIGSIQGNEAKDSLNTLDTLEVGGGVTAAVLEPSNAEGEVVLSLRRAAQMCSWERFAKHQEEGDVITVKAFDANKGGLLCVVDGIRGFVPVSQLAPEHYPRVSNADGALILAKLKRLTGIPLKVKVMSVNEENHSLVFSEREVYSENLSSVIEKLAPGTIINGKITGVVNFGVFVAFDDGLEGLAHISELSWEKVDSAHQKFTEGDDIKAMILGVEDGRIALSIKRLTPDPWVAVVSKYNIGDIISGKVTDIAAYGALVGLDKNIRGLIHVSEFVVGREIKSHEIGEYLNAGEEVSAKIIGIDNERHHIMLSLAQARLER